MKLQGVLQPVVVRPGSDGFELIAGERRWRAAQIAGLLKIPALVRETEDEQLLELALIENIQRAELNPMESAAAFQGLIDDLGLTQQEVADRVGKQRATVANMLRLLHLPLEVQTLVRAGSVSLGHAKALASLGSPSAQVGLAQRLVRDGLSVRQVEAIAARSSEAAGLAATRRASVAADPNVTAAEEALQRALKTKVRIVQGRSAGRIELHFFGPEELQRVYQLVLTAGRSR